MSKDKWIFDSREVENELPHPPQRLLDGAVMVKHNPVREVFFHNGYFIKRDSRKNHTFAKEFAAAQKLRRRKIAVVEHLAHGKCEDGNYLITRGVNSAVTVEDHLFEHPVSEKFTAELIDFLRQWKRSGFFHTDAHLGNILYVPEKSEFTLVDVRGVRRKLLWESLPFCCPADVMRFIFNLRGHVTFAKIEELFSMFNCRHPRHILQEMLKAESARLLKEWDKRKRQLFNAYPKFSCQNGKSLVAAQYKDNYTMFPAEESENAGAEFAASFFLTLFQIPHRRVCAVDLEKNQVRRAPELQGTPDTENIHEAAMPLDMCGLSHEISDWRCFRGMAALNDLNNIIRARMFQ